MDQKTYFINKRIKNEQIECFYISPDQETYDTHRLEFNAMRDELSQCRIASLVEISKAFSLAAKNNPKYIYVYATGHGMPPLTAPFYFKHFPEDKENIPKIKKDCEHFDRINNYTMVSNLLDEKPSAFSMIQTQVCLGKADPDLNIFTPKFLSSQLKQFSPKTKKIVILQGCFTGGFLKSPFQKEKQKYLLTTVPNISVLTATNFDRTSWHCISSCVGFEGRSFFGNTYINTLKYAKQLPHEVNFKKFAQAVGHIVMTKEAERGKYPQDQSVPLWFDNTGKR